MNRAHRELQVPGRPSALPRRRRRPRRGVRARLDARSRRLGTAGGAGRGAARGALRPARLRPVDRRSVAGLPTSTTCARCSYALGVVSPLLVGMSQGARVVLEFAARHPGVARGLVLDGPPPLRDRCAPTGAADLPMADRSASWPRATAWTRSAAQWSAHPLTQLADRRCAHARAAGAASWRATRATTSPARQPPRETLDAALLAQVRTPALIVNGARDTEARRRAGLALRAALPAAEHVLIPQAGAPAESRRTACLQPDHVRVRAPAPAGGRVIRTRETQ